MKRSNYCTCYKIAGEQRRSNGWIYCGNCGRPIGGATIQEYRDENPQGGTVK